MRKLVILCALVAAVVLPAVATAQVLSLYYAEETKDGRIYVFNTAEKHKLWKEAGDMGVSITLPGAGKNGETLVVENETAADLYFFKHDLPGYERTTPDGKLPFDLSWKDGKTTIKSKNAQLGISNRVQFRFTEQMPEVGDDKGSFRVRRAKTKFDGWVYTKDLTYELQLNWADTSNALEDANFNYDFSGGRKAFQLKFGQFKVPFGRQELTSSGSQQFVDRSLVSNAFARGRDLGVQIWGTPLNGTVDWRVGIFNGEGRNQSSNLNTEFQYNARVTWQPFGDVKYSESDFESADRPLFAIAAQYEQNDRQGTTTGNDLDREIVGGDVAFKFKGISAFAEYFDGDSTPETGRDFAAEGVAAQVGYLFDRRFEIAARYAVLDPSDLVDGNDQIEQGVALSYYFNKHNYKLQADFRQIENEATKRTDDEIRLQYQMIF